MRALTVRAEQDGAIDLTAIAELTQLKTLILYIEVPLDLRPLNRCGNLKSLIIWDHSLGEVQSLPGAPDGLNHLGLYGCIGFTDLMGIEDFNRLTSIVIDNCYNLTVSWQWLRMLPDLREVSIYRPHAIDLSGFRHSGRETKLKLSECGELDLTPLAGDAPVEVIHDSGTQLTNVPDNVRVIPTE